MGSFLGTFFVCNSQQPRIWGLYSAFREDLLCMILILLCIPLCGFMVNFIVVHRGAILGDMSYDDACGLASCCSLGFAASSVAMAVAGKKVVQMGIMRPDLLSAENMRAVKFGS